MKLTPKQKKVLKHAARRPSDCWCQYGPGSNSKASKQTVEELLQMGLVQLHEEVPTGFQITDQGRKVHRETLKVPDITPLELNRMTGDELKTFVRHYCDGKVLCDFQVPPSSLGLVFMPLLFGGLPLPDGLCPDPPTEPIPSGPPQEPVPIPKPTKGRKPKPPKRLADIQEEIKTIRARMDWDEADEIDLKTYLDNVDDEKTLLDADWAKTKAQYHASSPTQEDLDLWASQRDAQAAEYFEAQRAHEREQEGYGAKLAAYEVDLEDHHELHGEITQRYLANLGLIYEYFDQAVSTMAINGFPTFGSCRLMHREDWERAQKAITKELERRKDIQV